MTLFTHALLFAPLSFPHLRFTQAARFLPLSLLHLPALRAGAGWDGVEELGGGGGGVDLTSACGPTVNGARATKT